MSAFRDDNMRAVAEPVARSYGLTIEQLRIRRRHRSLAWPRQHVMHALRQETFPNGLPRWSLPQVAAFLNLKDHTTVVHGVRAHAARTGA